MSIIDTDFTISKTFIQFSFLLFARALKAYLFYFLTTDLRHDEIACKNRFHIVSLI